MMTPTFTTEDFAALGGPALVYVRPIKASEVIDNAPAEAVMVDKDSAYAAAFANELAPVSVH